LKKPIVKAVGFFCDLYKMKQVELLLPVCPKSTINLTYTKYYGTANLITTYWISSFFVKNLLGWDKKTGRIPDFDSFGRCRK